MQHLSNQSINLNSLRFFLSFLFLKIRYYVDFSLMHNLFDAFLASGNIVLEFIIIKPIQELILGLDTAGLSMLKSFLFIVFFIALLQILVSFFFANVLAK